MLSWKVSKFRFWRNRLIFEGFPWIKTSPVYDPPNKEALVSSELWVVAGNVGGQDSCGGNVGDRYEEQTGRGQTKQPGVVYGAIKDEDPGGVEEKVYHQQEEEGVGEDKRIIEQSRQGFKLNSTWGSLIKRLTVPSQCPFSGRRQCWWWSNWLRATGILASIL